MLSLEYSPFLPSLLTVAAAIKDLRQTALRFMGCMVRHYTMIAISQQCGPFPVGEKQNKLHGMDTQILVDALAVIMGHEEKELCKPGNLALVVILDTATTILGSKHRVTLNTFLLFQASVNPLPHRLCKDYDIFS